MQLKIKKSQRTSMMMGKPIFQIEVRADINSEEQALIKKYSLGAMELYTSEDRKKNLVGASLADPSSVKGALSMTKSLIKSALSLKVTVNDLASGKTIEAKDLSEVIDAEETLIQAGKNLIAFLNTAKEFDGREVVHEL